MTDRVKAMVEQFKAGQTLQEIGDRFGVTRERVRQLLKKAGFRRRDGGQYAAAAARAERAVELLNAGLTRTEAEKELGYKVWKVSPTVSREERWEARFWRQVDKSGGPDACWPWTGCVDANGYGHTNTGRVFMGAHRRAFIYTHRDEVAPRVVRHACDNRRCCNPAHLIGGTQAENVQDREERSDLSRRVKWSPSAIEARDKTILALLAEGVTQVDIGKRLGMGQPRVNGIVVRLRAGQRRWQKKATV